MVRMQFPEWLAKRVDRASGRINDLDLRALARGPNLVALSYHGFNINGFAFRTMESEKNKVPNSGVMVQSVHDNDDNESIYYGRLTNIVSLDYSSCGRIVLFQCDWVNPNAGTKIDPFGFTMVNFSRLIHTGEREEHEPFILASQARMVYYVHDPKEEDWYCTIRHTPRDTYNMGDEDDNDTLHFIPNNFSDMNSLLGDMNNIDVELIRTDWRDQLSIVRLLWIWKMMMKIKGDAEMDASMSFGYQVLVVDIWAASLNLFSCFSKWMLP